MRSNHIAAAVVVSLACTLLNASCAQSRSGAPEADGAGGGPVIETTDDGDPFGSDPDVGGGIGSDSPIRDPGADLSSAQNPYYPAPSERPEPQGWFTYHVCAALKNSSAEVRSAFCISQPDRKVRGRCRSHLCDSPVSWQNYCYNEFNAE